MITSTLAKCSALGELEEVGHTCSARAKVADELAVVASHAEESFDTGAVPRWWHL